MCRHLAYLGPPKRLAALLCEPPHGLARQSWAPRRQRHGTMNVDGFGVGWYADGDPVPARYRRGVPFWSDPSFADLVRVVSSPAVLAAVRSATPGQAAGEAAAAPFADGPFLFSHNGCLPGWPDASRTLAEQVPASYLVSAEVLTDSGLLWARVRRDLDAGHPPESAVAATVRAARAVPGARLNLLLTDGARIVATACGDTLAYRVRPGEVVVASEPDGDGDWTDVPDGSLLVATRDGVQVDALARLPVGDLRHDSLDRMETP